MKRFFIFISLIGLVGCAPLKQEVVLFPDEYAPSTHEVVDFNKPSDRPRFLSCNYEHYADAYSNQVPDNKNHNKAAVAAYKFALMASNSYHDNAFFTIKDWHYVKHYRGKEGSHQEIEFQADIWEYRQQDQVEKIAIVFRGTDGKGDWDANLKLATEHSGRMPAQYQIAKTLYNQLKSRDEYKQARVYLVGHSLGGSLAYHVSWYHENVLAFTFNASERKWVSGKATKATRYVLRENDEILTRIKFIRYFSPLAPDTVTAEEYDFSLGNSIRQHNMYNFARGLLLLAAANGDSDAKAILNDNLMCELAL
ncbi:Mbeg1-like protein [Marinomonas sp. THO17]|uniref:Mbeg1-like protein n=1 Tax=Marinomonas sp. THO17 TaxID=3149048 RepID=UPI00336BD192